MHDLITWQEAQRLVLKRAAPLAVEWVPLAEAAGRVSGEAVESRIDLPPFDSSAMDGFAVRSQDTPGTLPVVAEVAAGRPAPRPLGAGEAMAISTGGVVPEGADAVIPVEYVVQTDNNIGIADAVEAGANVRPTGSDVHRGDTIVEAGMHLGAAQVGALAASGVPEVACSKRPRAAVLATGSELRQPGEALAPGQIYESNGLILAAQLASAGAEVESLAPVADDALEHGAALARGLESDLLVTTGGVSVGPHDLVRAALEELGVEEIFWGVSVKPGKPISFGVREDTLVFGLPGNPVSALVGFELFVRPAVRALQGEADPGPRWERAELTQAVVGNEHRDELIRARAVSGAEGTTLEPLSGRESHMIARAASADALVLVPRGEGELPAGSRARFLRLR